MDPDSLDALYGQTGGIFARGGLDVACSVMDLVSLWLCYSVYYLSTPHNFPKVVL